MCKDTKLSDYRVSSFTAFTLELPGIVFRAAPQRFINFSKEKLINE
jgi:hypothetical protein